MRKKEKISKAQEILFYSSEGRNERAVWFLKRNVYSNHTSFFIFSCYYIPLETPPKGREQGKRDREKMGRKNEQELWKSETTTTTTTACRVLKFHIHFLKIQTFLKFVHAQESTSPLIYGHLGYSWCVSQNGAIWVLEDSKGLILKRAQEGKVGLR